MKNSELEVLHNSLSNLADVKLPYKISYAVTKNILELEDTLKLVKKMIPENLLFLRIKLCL